MDTVEMITWGCMECGKIFGIPEGEEAEVCPYCESEAVGCISEGVS